MYLVGHYIGAFVRVASQSLVLYISFSEVVWVGIVTVGSGCVQYNCISEAHPAEVGSVLSLVVRV